MGNYSKSFQNKAGLIPPDVKFLYHGTAASRLANIQALGIAPRFVSNAKANVSESVSTLCGYRRASGSQHVVYLSRGNDSWHFALNSVGEDGPGLVLEIPTDRLQSNLVFPDETLLDDETTGEPNCYSEHYWETLAREAQKQQHRIVESLVKHGWVGYWGTVPWSAVSRYVIIDHPALNGHWQHFTEHTYESTAFNKWIFGDSVSVSDFIWPLAKFSAEDTRPKANRAWTRWLCDHSPNVPVRDLGNTSESDEDACPVEDRQSFVEEYTRAMQDRSGLSIFAANEAPSKEAA